MYLKLRYLILPIIVLTLLSSAALAQVPAPSLESLYIAFWPDYDDPSVLVLMTGTLPATAALPAAVTIPVPSGAEVNAVARVNEQGMADTEFEVQGDSLTLVTPDPQFRVEFYVPYEQEGDLRTFNYDWEASVDVEEFIAEIQQPLNASSLTTQPPPATSGPSPNDGLTYHALPPQRLPANTPFNVSFSYEMSSPGLTAGQAAPPPSQSEPATPGGTTAVAPGVDWLLVGAGIVILLLAIVVTWLVATRFSGGRSTNKPRRPRKPAPKAREAQTIYCHSCGTPANKGDQFCRSCGTRLKNV